MTHAAGAPRCGNCRHWGHKMRQCPAPRRTTFSRTVHVPGTMIALLSRPTKMPGASWSLPAGPACPFARTGPNTICGSCYATKGNYAADPAIKRAQWARFDWARVCMRSVDGVEEFVTVMIEAIKGANAGPYMRVHDSGDLFSPIYTCAWIEICSALPAVRFWFPTRSWQAAWVDTIAELAALPNVTVRPSAIHFEDEPPRVVGLHAGTSASATGYTCPAHEQNNACNDCRACWDSPDQAVSYHAHMVAAA